MKLRFLRIASMGDTFDITEYTTPCEVLYSVPVVTVITGYALKKTVMNGSAILTVVDSDLHINGQPSMYMGGGIEDGWVCMRFAIAGTNDLICVPIIVVEHILHVGKNQLSTMTVLSDKTTPTNPLNALCVGY